MIEVILTQDVKSLGEIGKKVRVELGYARNFLFKKGLALQVNKANLKRFEQIKKKAIKIKAKLKADAEAIKQVIDGKEIIVEQKTNKNKLYGSVTPAFLISQIKEKFEMEVEAGKLDMPAHIKTVGEYEIPIKFYDDVVAKIKLTVKSQNEDLTDVKEEEIKKAEA